MGAELTCERDKTLTRLTCTQCASPICPQCFVRTPVGLKCTKCGAQADAGAPSRTTRPWVVPLVIGVVLLAVLGLPRLLSGSSSSSNEDQEAEPVSAAPAPEGPARFALLGEEALDGSAAFVARSFECGATEVGSGGALRRSQGRYCFLTVTVRNVGRAPVNLVGSAQALLDNQSRRYGIDERATAAHPANVGRDPVSSVINPSNELEAVFVFDVPPDVDPLLANLRSTPRGRGAMIRLVSRP